MQNCLKAWAIFVKHILSSVCLRWRLFFPFMEKQPCTNLYVSSSHIFLPIIVGISVFYQHIICYCLHEAMSCLFPVHYSDIIMHFSEVTMSAMASEITGSSIVCSTVCSGAQQRNTKAQRHWPLWGKTTGGTQRASNAEYVSNWWCQHGSYLSQYDTFHSRTHV